MSAAKRQRPATPALRDVTTVTRYIPWATKLVLAVRAGGRCEFDGHNRYLFQDSFTKMVGNFAEFAHIIAFSAGGPRAAKAIAEKRKNDVSNLMLLCPTHHKLVDDSPALYPVKTLRAFKKRHEMRIHHLTSMRPDSFTTVLVLKSMIGAEEVQITRAQVQEAVAPRYPQLDEFVEIDLTDIPHTGNPGFVASATAAIDQKVGRLLDARYDGETLAHISVFALSTMPVLMYLGSRLSNKVPVDVFQRHRDTKSWAWKNEGDTVEFAIRALRRGTDSTRVALFVSLSGRIKLSELPATIDESFSVYELTPASQEPGLRLLRKREDLESFAAAFERAVETLGVKHDGLAEIHVFPAMPAPAAVMAGHVLMKRRHPSLVVYDFDKNNGGFAKSLRIN